MPTAGSSPGQPPEPPAAGARAYPPTGPPEARVAAALAALQELAELVQDLAAGEALPDGVAARLGKALAGARDELEGVAALLAEAGPQR